MHRIRKLTSRGAQIAKHGFPHGRNEPHIFIISTVESGLVNTIGRIHEIELTLDEAFKLKADLDRVIEDISFRLDEDEDRALV